MTKKPQINCMFDFYGIDVSDVVDETIKNGICVAQVGKNCGKDRKFYIRSFDDSPSGFVVCVREHDHTPGYLVETIYPIFEGAKNNVEIQDVLKIDSTAAHMIIYCDEKSRETRIVHNPLAFNKLAKIGKNCTINLAGYVGNVYEISNQPIFPNGSFSDNGMSVYKCLFMDYVINNKTKDEDPEDDVLREYVKEKKIFYNNLDSDSFKFISDILNVEQFTYMGELLYRLTIKVRKSLRSKDMMEIFLYVGESCLKGHTPKVGEYIYGNCGLIGYMGDWNLITQKIKLDKQDEQYIKEMMEMYGLTRDQAIKQLDVLRAHGF